MIARYRHPISTDCVRRVLANTKMRLGESEGAPLAAGRWAFAGALALWLSFPPVGWWPLAPVGAAAWTRLTDGRDRLDRRGWRTIWLASLAFWLGMNYFVTLPHWAGAIGWIAMSSYLALFFPLFVWLARSLRRYTSLPSIVACPLAWVAMEYLRAHLISGYGMAMLPHALYRQPLWIQTSDLIGAYGVSAWLVAVAVGLEGCLCWRSWRAPLLALLVLGAAGGYGAWRLQFQPDSDRRCVVAVIQGSRDVVFGLSPQEELDEALIKFSEYRDLTRAARVRWPDCQLVAWPEGMFPAVDYLPIAESESAADVRELVQTAREEVRLTWQAAIGLIPLRGDPPGAELLSEPIALLAGASSVRLPERQVYNSSLLIDRRGEIVSRYFKMHLVMFGEYVPLGERFPWVYRLTPIPGGLTAGRRPEVFEVGGVRFAPSICFESTVARVIRRQVVESASGREPDCLVNLTNDGWFYGSSCLDQHLACNVFRAVELRKPVLVAANTGFSAHIDGSGRILAQGPRRQTASLRAEVVPDGRRSLYTRVGDWPALAITVFAVGVWIFGFGCNGRRGAK